MKMTMLLFSFFATTLISRIVLAKAEPSCLVTYESQYSAGTSLKNSSVKVDAATGNRTYDTADIEDEQYKMLYRVQVLETGSGVTMSIEDRISGARSFTGAGKSSVIMGRLYKGNAGNLMGSEKITSISVNCSDF